MTTSDQATNAHTSPSSRSVLDAASRALTSIFEGQRSSIRSDNREGRGCKVNGSISEIGCDVPSNLSDDDDDDDEISVNDIDFSVHETELASSVLHGSKCRGGVGTADAILDDNVRIDIDEHDDARKVIALVRPSLPPIGRARLAVSRPGGCEDSQELIELRQRVGQALRDVLSFLPKTKMTSACQEAIARHAHTGEMLDSHALEELQQLANVLQGDPVPQLSRQCYENIATLALSGQPLTMNTLKELKMSRALEFCSNPPANYQDYAASTAYLSTLRAAVMDCTLATSALSTVPEILALWELIHNSISYRIPADTVERDISGNEKASSSQANTAVASPLLLATGNVKQKEGSGDSDSEEGDNGNNIFDASKAKITAQTLATKGLRGVQKKLRMDRRKVDAALQAMRDRRNILAGGCATAMMAYLPPLLRLEIMRDFFQITGLFFSGMYGPVFEFIHRFRPSSWILAALTWFRNIYNIVALDASELLHYLSAIVEMVGTGFFLGGILLVHGLFIMVVVRYWWTMPRTADQVRHGHEATTWSMLATQSPRAAKLATLFITYCLTVYLPLTQLAYKVLVVTNKHSDGDGVKLTKFVQQFRDGPWWFLFPFEAVLILLTFSLSLPLLLVWSIRKNRPTGSIENEDVTYNLDGEPVKFDDKIYTKLISNDPNQLDCPYRSLYAGFERNWSTYKVMQMVAKIVIAMIVVSAGQSVEVGGTLISTFYFGVVILSQYSQPFISAFDDKMELLSKFTALTTAVGATAVDYAKKNNWIWNPDRALRFMGFVVVIHGTNLLVMALATLLGLLGDESFRIRMKQVLGRLSFSDTTCGVADAPADGVVMKWNVENEAKHRVWQSFWRTILLEMTTQDEDKCEDDQEKNDVQMNEAEIVKSTERLAQLEDAVIASGLDRIKAHCIGQEYKYTAQLRQLARVALEGVDVFWDNPLGARDGHLDSVTCFGKMYVVPYPFHCVVVYDDADDEAVVRDICDENFLSDSHLNLAKFLSINFTPEILAKRELRQKLRVLSDTETKVDFPFSRTEKVFLGPRFRGWKRIWRWLYRPVLLMPGYYKFECNYTQGVIRVHTSSDASGTWLRVVNSHPVVTTKQWVANMCARKWVVQMKQQIQKLFQGKNVQRVKKQVLKLADMEDLDSPGQATGGKRIMADGFNVTMEYADGHGAVLLCGEGDDPNIIHKFAVDGPLKTVMKADHIGLKPSMEESSKLHDIFDSTRSVWEPGLRKLRKQHRDYRRTLAEIHENQNAVLGDGFWYYVYNNARLPRSKLEEYLRLRESNPMLKSLPETHSDELDALYRQQQWVFRDPRTTCWYVFWDDVYACNSDMKYLDPQDFDPVEPTSICNQEPMARRDLEEWLRKRGLLKQYRLFHPALLDLLYAKLDEVSTIRSQQG